MIVFIVFLKPLDVAEAHNDKKATSSRDIEGFYATTPALS